LWEHTSTMSKNYRKIYEDFHSVSLLAGIDIHHIDGNHHNNNPANLQAVTLQEHYDIHKLQCDYYACVMIAARMKIPPDDWIQMAKENGRKSAINNINNGIGLLNWIKNNPELAALHRSAAGKISGRNAVNTKSGIHGLSKEDKIKIASQGGKKTAERGAGFKSGNAALAGKIGGKKGGQWAKENKSGIFALTSEQINAKNQKAALTKLVNNGKACRWPRLSGQ